MNAPLNFVIDILYKKGIDEGLIYYIIQLVYHEEHQYNLYECFEGILSKAFRKENVCLADIETAVRWYYTCNCCERHSYNKALINDNDLIIVTKPCVFKAWRYDTGDKPYEWCQCDCRQRGRALARHFLKNKKPENPYGVMMPNANGTHRPMSLGIRATLEDHNH